MEWEEVQWEEVQREEGKEWTQRRAQKIYSMQALALWADASPVWTRARQIRRITSRLGFCLNDSE